jgi:hypothetical protein
MENEFLIRYGLHNFVTYAQLGSENAFVIQGVESPKMIRHAMSLIKGSFGRSANIKIT